MLKAAQFTSCASYHKSNRPRVTQIGRCPHGMRAPSYDSRGAVPPPSCARRSSWVAHGGAGAASGSAQPWATETRCLPRLLFGGVSAKPRAGNSPSPGCSLTVLRRRKRRQARALAQACGFGVRTRADQLAAACSSPRPRP